MKIKAWHFLVSRNQSLDYKTVVVPDFLSDAKVSNLLARVAEGDLTAQEQKANIRWIEVSHEINFTIVFQVNKSKTHDIGESGDEVLKDSVGREIYLVEGLVIEQKPYELTNKITKSHLDQAHQELKKSYKKFWNENTISISQAFWLAEDTSSLPLALESLEPFSTINQPQSSNISQANAYPITQVGKIKMDKNKKRITSVFPLLVIVFLLLFLLGIWIGTTQTPPLSQQLGSENCLYKTQVQPIIFDGKKDVGQVLESFEEKYPNSIIFLSGNLNLSKNKQFPKLPETKKNQDKAQAQEKWEPTIRLNKTTPKQAQGKNNPILEMKSHPLKTAIAQLRNQQVTPSRITVTIIQLCQ